MSVTDLVTDALRASADLDPFAATCTSMDQAIAALGRARNMIERLSDENCLLREDNSRLRALVVCYRAARS